MKHSGKARGAAFKLILLSLLAGAVIWVLFALGMAFLTVTSVVVLPILIALWIIFSLFTFYFFRDPTPKIPAGANLILSPAHGKVDVIDTTTEKEVLGGECRRVSVFLSV